MRFYHKKVSENETSIRIRLYILGMKFFSYVFSRRKYYRYSLRRIQAMHRQSVKKIRAKVLQGKPIRVCFTVSISAMFPGRPLFETMLQDTYFSPYILIIPDVRFGSESMGSILDTTYQELEKLYGAEHITLADCSTADWDSKLLPDIIVPSLPYDHSLKKYNVQWLHKKGVLSILINYGYGRAKFDRFIYSSFNYASYWKVYLESKYNMVECQNFSLIGGANAILTGYCKMDGFKGKSKREIDSKVILLCPHHEGNELLGLSNFSRYSDFFLTLPTLYPTITFVFRPHPALFLFLRHEKKWGDKRVTDYIERMRANPNVVYSDSGSYFNDFSISDGIIQDCGSYLVEYFYTKKPCCYMLKSPSDIEEKFTELGQLCLESCYIAYNEEAILSFLDDVILKGRDSKKDKREALASNVIMLNYPQVTQVIIDELKKSLSTRTPL